MVSCGCDGCSGSDVCVYHYLFESPIPAHVTQLRGQREAPVPFILSPPVVENPIQRVCRLPAPQVAFTRAVASSALTPSRLLSGSEGTGASLANPLALQSATGGRKSAAITSVMFPDRPRRFAAGDILSFNLVLIGRASEYLTYVTLAMSQMARRGLGATRAQFELKEVWLNGLAS